MWATVLTYIIVNVGMVLGGDILDLLNFRITIRWGGGGVYYMYSCVWALCHSGDTRWLKQSKMEVHNKYLNQIVWSIETQLMPIYHMSKCNWNKYLYVKCVFWLIKLVIPKYHLSCLNELTLEGNIFMVVFMATNVV